MEVGEPTSLAVNYRYTLADMSMGPSASETTSDVMSEDEVRALRATPPEIVVANHVFHLLELAALHLSSEPPQLVQAQLVIDAVAGLLQAVGNRLGEHSELLREGLTQIRLAYVRLSTSME